MASDDTKKIVLLALVTSFASAAAAFWASASTGAAALVAVGLLFLAASTSQALMLVGLFRRQPQASATATNTPDLYVWCFVAALMLFALSAGVAISEGIGKLTAPPRILLNTQSGYGALAFALILTCTVLVCIAMRNRDGAPDAREGAPSLRAADPALQTTTIESIAALASLGIAGLGFAFSHAFDSPAADGNAAILIGLLIGTVAAVMAVEIRRLLVSASASRAAQSSALPQLIVEQNVTENHDAPDRSGGPRLSRGEQKKREQQLRRHPRSSH